MVASNNIKFKKRVIGLPVDRKINVKHGLNQTYSQRRCDEGRIQIRKTKGGERLAKSCRHDCAQNIDHNMKGIQKKIEKMMQKIRNGNQNQQQIIEIVREFRRILAVRNNPPVEILDKIINAGVLPYLVMYLHQKIPVLVFESAWVLTNIASTCRDHDVVESGAVPYLIELLRHDHHEIRDQAAWCLGNIAGNPKLQSIVLHGGAIDGLILNIQRPATPSLLSNATQAIAKLCRGSLPLKAVAPVLQTLLSLLCRDECDIAAKAMWALSYIAAADNEYHRQKMMETSLMAKLVEILKSDSTASLITPAVRCIGSLVAGDNFQTQKVLDSRILKYIPRLLEHPMKNIRKEACWVISNIAGGTTKQISQLFGVQHLLVKVIKLAKDGHWEVRREAIWAICNIFTTGSDQQVIRLVQLEGLGVISSSLEDKDLEIVMAALKALERVLSVGEKESLPYLQVLEEHQGIDRIEGLQGSPNESVYKMCVHIMERFFGVEEDDEKNAPLTKGGGTYGFELLPNQFF